MKRLIFFAGIIFLFSRFSCEENLVDCQGNFPCCMNETVENYLKNHGPANENPANISKYSYNGKIVFVFDPGSNFADWLYEYVDEDCNVICETGGIAGMNTCTGGNLTFLNKVWEDTR